MEVVVVGCGWSICTLGFFLSIGEKDVTGNTLQ